jgi:glycerol-3-phosphate acyltransferase PlsY
MTGYYVLYLLIPLAYLIGSIPFGVLLSKRRGIDLRATGSGNIGATNVLRTMGKMPALLTLLGDSLKGVISVMLCRIILNNILTPSGNSTILYPSRELWEGIIGFTAIVGHIYSVFLSFKGGKGVATGFGVLAIYSPLSALIMFFIWISVVVFTKYSSLGGITAFIALPLILLFLGASFVKLSFALAITILIVYKHKDNIKRLIQGTEAKIGK